MMSRLAASAAALAILSACASTPEPCTPEWVEYKTEKILTRFARANRADVQRLKTFAETLDQDDISPLVALQIPAMIEDFRTLADNFEADALPMINAAIDQCGRPEELVPAFAEFLRREGVGEDVLEWVELLGAFMVES
ncbi:MAG: hypothetical protein GYB42_09225 [Alphaproteobacteria bacterium]|nr:hypothetical protein [Alphaproteobacteria bacterium]